MTDAIPMPSRNGTHLTPAKKRGRPKKSVPVPPQPQTVSDKVKLAATVVMGTVIPLLSLGLSHTGGTLARSGHPVMAAFALILMGCVLAVSLSHLAWSIRDITKSPVWAAWLLAVAFDLVLVLAELSGVTAEDAGVGVVTTLMMIGIAGLSMFLNC